MDNDTEKLVDAIAVIGAAGRFPKAATLEDFWTALRSGKNCTDTISLEVLKASGIPDADLETDTYITAMGRIDGVMEFDAAFFGLTAHEAELMDPQQRKLLECGYESLEDAGYSSGMSDLRVGVYVAASHSSYLPSAILGAGTGRATEALQMAIGNDRDYLATRISNVLDLRGPSLTVQTACSSSLTAVHLACQSLLSGECDMALAGGVSITLPQTDGYRYREGLIISKTGVCRPFDAQADGTINGNGVGVVLLKPLDAALRDGDVVRAVIRGTAVNNDGADKMGYTAPSVQGEASVISEALAVSDVPPDMVEFVSTHGTATAIGDPIEVEALTRAFGTARTGFCTLGAVKANIGHLDAAAGIAGFLEGMLALEHKELPPIAGFNTPNPDLRLDATPFVIRTASAPWDSDRRFAMVNAFGFGGTNVSVILEEAPKKNRQSVAAQGPFILPLSASTPEGLELLLKKWQTHLEHCPDIANACWTAASRRRHLACRKALVGATRAELLTAIRKELAGGTAEEKSDGSKAAAGPEVPARRDAFLSALCESFEKIREIVECRAAAISLPLASAVTQQDFCDKVLAEIFRTVGIDDKKPDILQGGDSRRMALHFLSVTAKAYQAGADIVWEAFLAGERTRIPLTPFRPVEHCHALAQRRERPPVDPVGASQDAAARMAAAAGHILEPELLAEREALLEDLCAAAVARAFAVLGFAAPATVDKALEIMRIPPQFAQLVERLLDALHSKGLLQREGDAYLALESVSDARLQEFKERAAPVWNVWGAMENLLLSTVDSLPELLRGERDLRETFMSKGDLGGARRIYSELPNSAYFNALVREHVREWLDRTASGEAVRIFEIGAGTGATTERILPLLPPDRASYTFTDVSPVFLTQAMQRFAEYGFLRAGRYDMSVPPEEQGFEAGIHDIVIASNVLHAAEDLSVAVRHASSLLRPGGLLLLYEITRANFLGEITTGLLLPNITDKDVRGIQPMASNTIWKDILAAEGFVDVQILPHEKSLSAQLPDRVISARFRPQDGRAMALPRSCTYATVWESREAGEGRVPLGRILLLADAGDAPLFEGAARERGLDMLHVPATLTAADLRVWLQGQPLCTLVDARALGETEHSDDCAEQERLCGGLLQLLAEIKAADLPDVEWHWASVTCGAARKITHPQQAPFWGMNRVVEMGHPELHLRQYDLADKTAQTVGRFFDLLLSGSGEELNAVSGSEWQTPRLERRALAEIPLRALSPDKNGWQMIVGGLGGIGLALAEDLVARGFRKIALLSRHSPDAEKKELLRELEKSGVTVTTIQADVTDYQALERAVAALEETAPVRSIYHCAVVKRVSNVDENKPWGAFWQILAPKVLGAWNLHRISVARKMDLDQMVLFSSSVSVVPSYSLPHYVAANAYLDALAVWRGEQGLPALSVSWGAWRDIGTVADPAQADHLKNGGLHSFSPLEGLKMLAAVQERNVPHLAVMKVDWARLLRQYGHRVPAYFSNVARPASGAVAGRQDSGVQTAGECGSSSRDGILDSLRSAPTAPEQRNVLEKWLKGRFAELLKISPEAIDSAASLFDLGVDSLMFIEMVDGLEKALDVKISPSSLLQDFCVEKIAAKLLPDLKLEKNAVASLAELFIPEPDKRYEPFRLTDVQRAYWVGRRQEMALGNTACQGYIEFDCENMDVPRLEDAWLRVIDRHAALRTVIGEEGLQRVLEETPRFRITVHDLTGLPEEERRAKLQDVRDRLSHKVHDPAVWPLFDLEVSLLPDNMCRLHVLMDNVVMDGRSISMLLAEWAAVYHDPGKVLPPEAVSFRDYIAALDRYRETGAFREAEAYWQEEGKLLPPAPDLPLSKDPASIRKPRFVRHNHTMAPRLWEALKAASGRNGVTISSTLLAAYAEVLGLWSRSPELTVNAPVFTRLPFHPDINNAVGEFTSSVLIRCETGREQPFAEKVKKAQQRIFDGLKFCQVSGIEVMRRKIRDGAPADAVRMPIVFTSTFGLAKMADSGFASSIAGFSTLGREVFNISQTPQVWIDNHVHDRDGTLSIYWDTVEELFPEGMIGRMFSAYTGLLERLAEDALAWTSPSPVRIEDTADDGAPASVTAELLHAGFLRNVLEQPDRPAVIDVERVLSYRELFSMAASLADRLAGALATSGTEKPLVAVAVPKGWRQAVAVLGVLFGGAAYVPVDPHWPLLRRQAVLAEAKPACVVVHSMEKTGAWDGLPLFPVGETDAVRTDKPEKFLQAASDSLAYVIFTSGTTGTPKGVMMSHAGATATLGEINRRFAVTRDDRVLALSALTFDLSVYDFFGIWAAGGVTVIPRENDIRNPRAWRQLMEKHGVTLWNSVPMFWQMLLESGELPAVPPRLALLSGDRIPVEMPRKCAGVLPSTSLVSLGGATEAGIWSICHEIPPDSPQPGWQSIPYGKALAGQSFHVFHKDLRPCPVGVPGELCIGGAALALGYLHNEEKTAEAFILHPDTGERIYRTGDMGVRRPGGDIEFLGRTDSQVKVGGFRIELGEIEAILDGMPGVSRCAVVLAKGRQLAAFVVSENRDSRLSAEAVRRFLEERLPQYMVPAFIDVVESLPLTPNGKVDRQKLSESGGFERRLAAKESLPGSQVEEALCAVWGELLEAPVTAGDNVFNLGADSLTAVRAEMLLKRRYGLKLSIQTVFDNPIICDMAKSMDMHSVSGVTVMGTPAFGETLFCLGDAVTDGSSFHDFSRYWPLGNVTTISVLPQKEDTLDTLVDRISGQISNAQPQGALKLVGYCAGGLLAWLVTERLRQIGRVVDRLVLIDCTPIPPGLHEKRDMLEGVVIGMSGSSSPELIENLAALCVLLENVEYPEISVPFAFVESSEIVGHEMGLAFWKARASRVHRISAPGNHANCLKRKQLLEWIARMVDWYETGGDENHA